jgi:hypothetical protein
LSSEGGAFRGPPTAPAGTDGDVINPFPGPENEQLVVDEGDPSTLLDLLNEDLFVGGLTSVGFRS